MTETCDGEFPTEPALGFAGIGGAGIGGGLDLLEGTLAGIGGAGIGGGLDLPEGTLAGIGGGYLPATGAGGFWGTGGGGNIIAIGAGGFSGTEGVDIAEDPIGVRE